MYDCAAEYAERCADLTRFVMTSGLYHSDPVLGSLAAALFSVSSQSCAGEFLCLAWLVNAIKCDSGVKGYLPANEYFQSYVMERVLMSSLAWYVNWEGFRAKLAQLPESE